jgi:hypothetical protein
VVLYSLVDIYEYTCILEETVAYVYLCAENGDGRFFEDGWYLFTRLHGTASQKTIILMIPYCSFSIKCD